MKHAFPAHGEYQLLLSNRILIAKVSGSWNLEAAQNYAQDFKQLAQALTGRPWAHLVLLDDWQLSVPEVNPVIHE